jgi:AbiV family abortive infection protein
MAQMNVLTSLSPTQVVELFDELLANADRLLNSAVIVLDGGSVGLARSLAILGLEESGKAIAIHERRAQMAYEPEGAAFVNAQLEMLWVDHKLKLKTAYDFLVAEEYWFDTQPPDPEANRAWLGEIEDWSRQHNLLKQRGFYVDVDARGSILNTDSVGDEESLRLVISHVHQIGWQLRLGEHIVAKRQEESARAIPPASAEEIERTRQMLTEAGVEEPMLEGICDAMRQGRGAVVLNNHEYLLHLSPRPSGKRRDPISQRCSSRPVSRPLTSSAPDRFGSSTCQRRKQSTHGVGHVFVRTDQREKVGEPRRRLADLRSLGLDVGQCVNEHGKCLTTGERRCRGQYGVEVGIAGGGGDGLCGGVVIGQKVCFVHT